MEYDKFLALDEEKRERILNAAMTEFASGFKKASTDNIVRAAGISKGILFHYFGTKENLYNFIVDYAISIMDTEFFSLINLKQRDILDSIWQLSLLKQDLSLRYPTIFDFMTGVYLDRIDGPAKEKMDEIMTMRNEIIGELYQNADRSLFREDIDPQKAIHMIHWAMEGFAESKANAIKMDEDGNSIRENYESYLAEFREYLNILRKCFYIKREDSQ